MKDNWKLLEESIMGSKTAYVELIQDAVPYVFSYYFTIYSGNQGLAIEGSKIALKNSFSKIAQWSQNELFVNWIISDQSIINQSSLAPEFQDQTSLIKFTELFSSEFCDFRLAFDFRYQKSFSTEEKEKAKRIISETLVAHPIELKKCLNEIKEHLSHLQNNWGYQVLKYRFSFILSILIIGFILGAYFLWNNNYPQTKQIDMIALEKIQAPTEIIFEESLKREDSMNNASSDDDEEVAEVKNPSTVVSIENKEKIDSPPSDSEKNNSTDKKKSDEPIIEKPVSDLGKTPEKISPVTVEKPKEVLKEPEKPNNINNSMAKIEPIKEDEKETEVEQEVVVLKGQEIPLLPKDESKANENAIRLGDDKEKHNLKDFKDQKVIFYSFLEVKDVEKAKEDTFKILAKFGYKGEVLKREKDYIILTATFPGKENHDRMIKKFNGLGTLYVGNDVAEFLELYKKDLDKEKSLFFPKYKPEDLPKEVTVNLYVFPKQK